LEEPCGKGMFNIPYPYEETLGKGCPIFHVLGENL